MSPHNFSQHVAILAKQGVDILESLDSEKCELMHHAYALSGEVGELQDAFKKHLFYGKDALDLSNIIEELGDIEFYLQGIRNNLGISRDETLEANIAKLSRRYPEGYSNEAALARADKNPDA